LRNLSRMTAPHWLGLYAALVAAWGGIWMISAPVKVSWATLIADLCRATPVDAGGMGLVAMWLLMSAAMMLPTALPAFATYDDIADAHGTGGGGALVAGYGLVWVAFALVAATVQVALVRTAHLDAPWLAPLLLAGAGAYQFSPMKDACLSKCRQPLTFFMGHWADGPLRMGVRLGAVCLGCCWALMALGLIGGAMSIAFMALATLLMTLEKLSQGTVLPRAIGLACFAGAGFLIGGLI